MNSLTHWKGTFELYQDRKFAEIVAKHYRLKVLDLDGLLVLARKNPLLGYTNAVIGSPEVKGPIQDCLKKIAPLKFSQLDIHTTQEIPSLSQYLVSPKNNMNMLIDLTDGEEKIFSRFSSVDKKGVQKAREKGLTIQERSDPRGISDFCILINRLSANGLKFDVPAPSFIEDLLVSRQAKLTLAVHDGRVIGGQIFLIGKDTIFGWYSCIDREFRHLEIGRSLVYEVIQWAAAKGFKLYDLGQQCCGDDSLSRYKMSFNPALVPAYSYRILSPGTASFLIRMVRQLIKRGNIQIGNKY